MAITVSIPCKPYVKKYLETFYGRPVKLPHKSGLRTQILSCLTKQFQPKRYFNTKLYTDVVEFTVGKNDLSTHGHSVSPQLHHHLHKILRERILSSIYQFITYELQLGKTTAQAIHDFQLAHNMDEETFSQEAIRSCYFRYKKELQYNFPKSATKKIA